MINKPQPKVYSGDICLGPEGVPWIEVPLYVITENGGDGRTIANVSAINKKVKLSLAFFPELEHSSS